MTGHSDFTACAAVAARHKMTFKPLPHSEILETLLWEIMSSELQKL